jgi:hypothetical protein
MKDMFGDDTATISEGAPAATPPPVLPATGAAPVAVVSSAPAPAPGTPAPSLQQSVDKAVSKATADATVASNPHATYSTKLSAAAPTVLGSTAAGALIGTAILPGPGTAVGALVGFVTEKYNIFGGPVGKLAAWATNKTRAGWAKASAPATLPKIPFLGGSAPVTTAPPTTTVGQGQGS